MFDNKENLEEPWDYIKWMDWFKDKAKIDYISNK